MARIVEIEGKKYSIADSRYAVDFTDHRGITYKFDDLWFHNPECHKAFKFTTILSVLKWWEVNRTELYNFVTELGLHYEFREAIEIYFDYLAASSLLSSGFEHIKSTFYGSLRRPSLKFHWWDNASSENLLLTEEEKDSSNPIPASLSRMYFGSVEVRVDSCQALTKWNRLYNYTFKMNSEEFNWWRSVKNENSVMFGMELEVCTKLSTFEIQRIVSEVEPKQEPFFIFKQDSSISGCYRNMLEFVTVPCTPRYLRKNWKIFFQKLEKLCAAKNMELKDVFDVSPNLSNGLHIHVSKDSFNDKSHHNKFMTAWNQWQKSVTNLFNAVSQRPTDYTKNNYCRINRSYKGLVLARRLKGLRSSDRMCVAHDTTGSTVEVRLYQGIFNLTHIMQCVSFTEAMFEFSQCVGYSNFDGKFVPAMSKFIRTERKYASLYSIFEKAAAK